MARVDNYYGTFAPIYGNLFKKLVELGYTGHNNQFRVVCKSKSRADANRKAESYGLSKTTFSSDFTSETTNALEVKLCDMYGFIVCLGGIQGNSYAGIDSLL